MHKNWDTQRIGTSLKIMKIIILADPKNWTILRKRKKISGILAIQRIGTAFFGLKSDKKTCLTLLVYRIQGLDNVDIDTDEMAHD